MLCDSTGASQDYQPNVHMAAVLMCNTYSCKKGGFVPQQDTRYNSFSPDKSMKKCREETNFNISYRRRMSTLHDFGLLANGDLT